ncbi:MAG: hypothetical protein L3I99_03860 [Sulfurimonas sp.]|nr:hypothetical protein [Sulfurimonas sp.]
MQYILILLISITAFASTYNFDEHRYVNAVEKKFTKSGTISIEDDKTVITYEKPIFKKIVANSKSIVIEDADGETEELSGDMLLYTKMYLDLIKKIDNVQELKSNDDFDIKKELDIYVLHIKNQLSDYVTKIEVKTLQDKISEFKIYMLNDDTIKIIKR